MAGSLAIRVRLGIHAVDIEAPISRNTTSQKWREAMEIESTSRG
jgi:hypothetical protein